MMNAKRKIDKKIDAQSALYVGKYNKWKYILYIYISFGIFTPKLIFWVYHK